MDKIIELVKQDDMRVKALDCVFALSLPQCYIAAGFVRNLVWDYLHNKSCSSPLNDIDVIYFDVTEHNPDAYLDHENTLKKMMPELNWQVRNQALMHLRNGDQPYQSSIDAMHYWPEKETAVAIRKRGTQQYQCASAFGFQSLLKGQVTHNPKRACGIFEKRLHAKQWLKHWPELVVV